MISRIPRLVAAAIVIAAAAACGGCRSSPTSTSPAIRLVPASGSVPARIELSDLPSSVAGALAATPPTADEWTALLRIAVADDAPPVLGQYVLAGRSVLFTPAFPFDAGRQYIVTFDPAHLPGASGLSTQVARVGLPAKDPTPTTVVTRVYPSGPVVPENLLRIYVEFSAPMGRGSGVDFVEILDDRGMPVTAPFLPLDYEFWSPDHRRFTLFFDPGRVKDGILPNQQMGRPLHAGRSYTLVVRKDWRDGEGRPLKAEYRQAFRVGPARMQALSTAHWSITPPSAGGRSPLVVRFKEALDHGLLMRSLGVRLNGANVAGASAVDEGELRWTFTPDEPWRPGAYHLLALSILEDVAGNRIGRAFEIDNFDTVDKGPEPQTVLIPFTVAARTS